MLLHFFFKRSFVYSDSAFFRELLGQFVWKAVCSEKYKRILSGDAASGESLKLTHPPLKCFSELCFLLLDNINNVLPFFSEIYVVVFVCDDDAFGESFEFALRNAEHVCVAYTAAQKAAEKISLLGVRRQNAVAYHKGGAADVVGNDAKRDKIFLVFFP